MQGLRDRAKQQKDKKKIDGPPRHYAPSSKLVGLRRSLSQQGCGPLDWVQGNFEPGKGTERERSLLSARRVRSFSAASASFSECGSRLRVGTLGAHGLLCFESSKMKSKRMVTSASSEPQVDSRQYFALTYDYIPDILEKRGPYRPGHIELAKALEAEGKMLLGGAWGAPVDGALFIFLVNSADEVQQFVDKDPYIEGGLVTKVTIRPVAAAVGTWVTAAKK